MNGLEMLPTAQRDLCLGDLVWQPKIGRVKTVKGGLGCHIYTVFLTLDLIRHSQWQTAMDYFEEHQHSPTSLGDLFIQARVKFMKSLQHPVVELIENRFEHTKAHPFGFSHICKRSMPKQWRVEIQALIESIPVVQAPPLFKRSRPIYIITELYYGNITYSTNRGGSARLDVILRRCHTETVNRYMYQNERVYEFAHQDLPFAMRIEALDDFRA